MAKKQLEEKKKTDALGIIIFGCAFANTAIFFFSLMAMNEFGPTGAVFFAAASIAAWIAYQGTVARKKWAFYLDILVLISALIAASVALILIFSSSKAVQTIVIFAAVISFFVGRMMLRQKQDEFKN